jgi:hypothetical protein
LMTLLMPSPPYLRLSPATCSYVADLSINISTFKK